ncbi:MAG TPA: nucleoside deaminase [Methylovirgula sp.]|nr:nucleoside deaminase [Methylovirgula sp.]
MTIDAIFEKAKAKISRRDAIAGFAAALAPTVLAASPAMAEARTSAVQPDDERLMREAIALAAQADYPFGAVITHEGKVLARGFNDGKTKQDPTAHGEMVAIRNFLDAHGPEALKGTTLYTSGEPCAMCMGAIVWCGIGRVVYAASVTELSQHIGQIQISAAEVAQKTPFATIEITGGVLAEDALKLFK